MKCLLCEAIFPPTYKTCPNCGEAKFVIEKFAQQILEVEEKETIYSEVVFSEISIGEMDG